MNHYVDRTSIPIDGMLFEASLAAMQGMLANRTACNSPEHIARYSVEYAKALIKELTNQEGGKV